MTLRNRTIPALPFLTTLVASMLVLSSCSKTDGPEFTHAMATKAFPYTVNKAHGEVVFQLPVFTGNVDLAAWLNARVDSTAQHLSLRFKDVLLQSADGANEVYPISTRVTVERPGFISMVFQDSCEQFQSSGMYFCTLNLDPASRRQVALRDLINDDGPFLKLISDSVRSKMIWDYIENVAEKPMTLADAGSVMVGNPEFTFETRASYEKFRDWYIENDQLIILFNTARFLGESYGGVERIPFSLTSLMPVLKPSPLLDAVLNVSTKK